MRGHHPGSFHSFLLHCRPSIGSIELPQKDRCIAVESVLSGSGDIGMLSPVHVPSSTIDFLDPENVSDIVAVLVGIV